MAEKLNPLYKRLKAKLPIDITSELKETFDLDNKRSAMIVDLHHKKPLPHNQILMTYAGPKISG